METTNKDRILDLERQLGERDQKIKEYERMFKKMEENNNRLSQLMGPILHEVRLELKDLLSTRRRFGARRALRHTSQPRMPQY